jgi:uncharacterized repeat protein (TIGR01451 family)
VPNGPVDLAVTASVEQQARVADRVAYSIAVANRSDGTAGGVTVTSTVPMGATVLSISSDRGDCEAASLACRIAFLPSGVAATITLVLRARVRGTLTVGASVTADQPDPDPASNQASASVHVRAPPALVVKRASRTRGAVTVVLTLDERAALHLRLLDAGGRLVRSANVALAGGRSRVVLRAPRAARRLAIRAVDPDGLAATLVVSLE